MQRLAISGLLSVMLIVLLTGAFVTRRDLASVVDRGVGPEERPEQANPAWVHDNVVPDPESQKNDEKVGAVPISVVNPRHRPHQSEPSAVGPPPVPLPGPYIVRPPNPPLDDVTHQRREKVKEASKYISSFSGKRNSFFFFQIYQRTFFEKFKKEVGKTSTRWIEKLLKL